MDGLEHAGRPHHHARDEHSKRVTCASAIYAMIYASASRGPDATVAEAATAHGTSSGSCPGLRVLADVMTSLAHSNARPQIISTTFAGGNRGFQAGNITGHVNAEFHHHAPGSFLTRPELHAAGRQN